MKPIKVTSAKYFKEYIIEFKFSDGFSNIVDLKNELWGEMFTPLLDKNVFRKFKLNDFTIEWENGADFAPEFLYEKAKKLVSAD